MACFQANIKVEKIAPPFGDEMRLIQSQDKRANHKSVPETKE